MSIGKKLNYKVLLIGLIVALAALALISFIEIIWLDDNIIKLQVILLLETIETSAIVVAIWDFIAKKSFANEMLDMANISHNISLSGIEYINQDFNDIDWKALLDKTKELKIAIIYANTWREHNRNILSKFVKEKGCLTVFMPDFNDINILNELALRFNTDTDSIKIKIRDSYKSFKNEIGAKVLLYNGSFYSSYYLLDNLGIMSFFNHKKGKSFVPAIQVNNQGELYRYITSEIKAIEDSSYAWKEKE